MAFGPNPPPIQAHICVKNGLEAIAFYERAFGGKCPFHQLAEDGKRVMHANIELFGSEVMLHDEFPEFGGDVLSPPSRGGASMTINFAEAGGCRCRGRPGSIGWCGDRNDRARYFLGRALWSHPRSLRTCLGIQRAAKGECGLINHTKIVRGTWGQI